MAIEPHLAGAFGAPSVRPLPALSPELALVDPELREQAIALLPALEAFDFLRFPPRPAGADVVHLDEYRAAPAASREPRRAVAALAYFAVALARVCVFNVLVFVSVALIVLLVNLAA